MLQLFEYVVGKPSRKEVIALDNHLRDQQPRAFFRQLMNELGVS